MKAGRFTSAAAFVVSGVLIAACAGGAATAAPTNSAAPVSTIPPATPAPSGLAIGSLLGSTLPEPPPGTLWTRVSDDAGTFSFEVPSTWTDHQSLVWTVGTTNVGTLVVASTAVAKMGTDFTASGVILGVATNAAGSTPRTLLESDDFSAFCTGDLVQDASGAGYTAAFRTWSTCGGTADPFLLTLAIAPTGSAGLVAIVLQGVRPSDLGYLARIVGSLQATSVTPTSAPPAPGTGQGYTITVDECKLELSDVIAIGTIRNTDTRSHAYVVRIRFTDQVGIVFGEGHQDVPALAPGEAFRYQTPDISAGGVTGATCTVVNVQVIG
jgi:hypothetical protein